MKLKPFLSSWKSTAIMILGALIITLQNAEALIDGDNSTIVNVEALITAWAAVFAIFMTRDADKSSQDAGIR